MTERRVIQISVTHYTEREVGNRDITHHNVERVHALCDDGSLWVRDNLWVKDWRPVALPPGCSNV